MKKVMAACSLAALAVVGMSTPAFAVKPINNDMNHPDYWAASPGDCVKVELPDGVDSYQLPTLPEGDYYYRIVLKAGTGYEELGYGLHEGSWYSAYSGKNISFVIMCSEEGYEYGS